MATTNYTRVTALAQHMMSGYLNRGDIVIDATMGNGYDTLFLSNMVGEEGKVLAFDIQTVALDKTRNLLEENQCPGNVTLIHDGHENMDKYVLGDVKGIMFNLGYLPGGNHQLPTKAQSTLRSLEKAIELLRVKGIITIVIYPGHPEGILEMEEILTYARNLNHCSYHVLKIDYINQLNNAPLILAIVKK